MEAQAAGVMSDAVGYMAGQLTMSKYREKIRRILYLDPESDNFHLHHKCPGYKPVEASRTVPQQVADRAVLQMAEAASEG